MKQEKFNQKLFQVISYITKREIKPQNYVTFFREIDCSVIENIRFQYSICGKKKPSYTAFIIKAVSQAIAEHPFVNARVFPGFPHSKIHKFKEINTAVACDKTMPGAEFFAFMDVIKQTDSKTIDQISRELTQLGNANFENNNQLKNFIQIIKNFPVFIARQLCALPTLFPSLWEKYRGACIIISSPAKYGVDCVSGTWVYPLGVSFGLVKKKPIVKNNKIELVSSFTLTLCFDRRIMAGAPAAKFFNCFANNLANKEFFLNNSEEKIDSEEQSIKKITSIALVV